MGVHPLIEWATRAGLTGPDPSPRDVRAALADRFGVSGQTVWRVVTGRQLPGWPLMLAVFGATAGEVSPTDFLTFHRGVANAVSGSAGRGDPSGVRPPEALS